MLDKVYIRYREDLPDSVNNFAAWDGFTQLGVETAPFYGFGDIQELADLGPTVGVAGFICDVYQALDKLKIPRPEVLYYPPELEAFLGRTMRLTTLQEVRRSAQRTFIKPVELKEFTGFVYDGFEPSRRNVVTHDDDLKVWACEPVEFLSEYRCFVSEGKILDVRHYKGDWSKAPNKKTVEAAVQAFKSSPKAYGLDFGVTSDGKTLLVEANDGFALGNYGLHSVLYAKLLAARWEELTAVPHKEDKPFGLVNS